MGEEMRVNCTSEKTLPPANLTWYINQQPVGLIIKMVVMMVIYQTEPQKFEDWNIDGDGGGDGDISNRTPIVRNSNGDGGGDGDGDSGGGGDILS